MTASDFGDTALACSVSRQLSNASDMAITIRFVYFIISSRQASRGPG
jgi:hypothetical protein